MTWRGNHRLTFNTRDWALSVPYRGCPNWRRLIAAVARAAACDGGGAAEAGRGGGGRGGGMGGGGGGKGSPILERNKNEAQARGDCERALRRPSHVPIGHFVTLVVAFGCVFSCCTDGDRLDDTDFLLPCSTWVQEPETALNVLKIYQAPRPKANGEENRPTLRFPPM